MNAITLKIFPNLLKKKTIIDDSDSILVTFYFLRNLLLNQYPDQQKQ